MISLRSYHSKCQRSLEIILTNNENELQERYVCTKPIIII